MLLVTRPRTPDGFNRNAQAARKAIRGLIQNGQRPGAKDFADAWSKYKHHLADAQVGRCGYCDRHVLGGDDGTIDHYCPKTEVTALHDDPATWGTQKDHSASVSGRETQDVAERGYHWLAYTWNNYVFACSCCNEKWKRAIFPIATHPRLTPPRPRCHEEPLLMNCYRGLRPSEHLQFNADGTVEPLADSRYGFETIRTVGLYRDPLRKERKAVAEDAHRAAQDYAEALDEASEQRAIRDLCKLGDPTRAFSGVARAIAEQHFGMGWGDILGLLDP